jgi:hypothetical protein
MVHPWELKRKLRLAPLSRRSLNISLLVGSDRYLGYLEEEEEEEKEEREKICRSGLLPIR